MTDKPILFSGPMVRALLDGRKTQTRRVLKPQPTVQDLASEQLEDHEIRGWACIPVHDKFAVVKNNPYAIGDRLYVREAFGNAALPGYPEVWFYRADDPDYPASEGHSLPPGFKWKSPIHMPRRASRLTLTVTDVRVQRLRDISCHDARAEGIEWFDGRKDWCGGCGPGTCCLHAFSNLWDSLNAKRGFGWDENPWVAAYTFTVARGNIDT